MPSWFKYVGAVDGAVVAFLTFLGNAEPSWQSWTTPACIAVGALGTILAGLHLSSQSPAPPAPPAS